MSIKLLRFIGLVMIYPQKLLFWSWLLEHWITLSTGHDWINHYPADMNYREAICVIENYPVDSVIRLSNFLRWLLFFQSSLLLLWFKTDLFGIHSRANSYSSFTVNPRKKRTGPRTSFYRFLGNRAKRKRCPSFIEAPRGSPLARV